MRSLIGSFVILIAVTYSASAEVLIGVAGPMTGKDAWFGERMQRGAELAVSDINTKGGVLDHQVRVIVADDFCDPEQAVAAAKKLVSDGVVMVVGHHCSGASIPASKVYEAAGVVQISPSSTNPLLTEQGRANVFRTIGRTDVQGVVAGNYLADHWEDKRIAILHDKTTYGMGLAEATKWQLNTRGVIETIYKAYAPGKNDYSTEVAALQMANVDLIYIGGYHTEVALMARAARDRNYSVQFVSGNAMAIEELALIAGRGAEGILFTFAADPRRNLEAAPVVARFRAENFEPDGYTLFTYAAVQAWADAVDKAGTLEPQAVIKSLHDREFDTVLGRIDFDKKGDLTNQNWVWYVWKDGAYMPLEPGTAKK